jgi:hypothetical protein
VLPRERTLSDGKVGEGPSDVGRPTPIWSKRILTIVIASIPHFSARSPSSLPDCASVRTERPASELRDSRLGEVRAET